MNKLLLFAFLLACAISCKDKEDDCDKDIDPTNKIGFMLHGGILDKYDNGRVYVSIVRINNPKDWRYNDYFTGKNFSSDEKEEMLVLERDSCELKRLYFRYKLLTNDSPRIVDSVYYGHTK